MTGRPGQRWGRSFILAMSCAVVLALTGSNLLAAAGPPAFKPEQMGGTLRWGLRAEPSSLNPLTAQDLTAFTVLDGIVETLIDRDPDTLEWRPLVADKWEVSADGKTITFHIDAKACFSDGTPVTADDVIFTYKTFMNPDINARAMASYFEDCQGCEKVDERTVKFTWKKTYFRSLELSGTIPVLPRPIYQFKDPKEFNEIVGKAVGSGPYVLKEWKAGVYILLERNSKYWRNAPAFDAIEYRFERDDDKAAQRVLAGELDVVEDLDPAVWEELHRQMDLAVRFQWLAYSTPTRGYSYIGWNNARPPFDDPKVRRAMTMLIPREEIVRSILFCHGAVATGPFWPKGPQNNLSFLPWPHDKDAALKLLKEAGYQDRDKDGYLVDGKGKRLSFELLESGSTEQNRAIARLISQALRQAGVDVNVKFLEWTVFIKKLDARDFDAVRLGWGGTVEDDPYPMWHSSQIADRGLNHVGFKNAEADRLIEEARATLDPKKRNDLYHQFHKLLHELQPYTFLWTTEELSIVSPRVKGVKGHKVGLDWHEWWIGKDEGKAKAE